MLLNKGEEDFYVLKAAVHALAVERDHGVSSVTENYNGAFEVVWLALYTV